MLSAESLHVCHFQMAFKMLFKMNTNRLCVNILNMTLRNSHSVILHNHPWFPAEEDSMRFIVNIVHFSYKFVLILVFRGVDISCWGKKRERQTSQLKTTAHILNILYI